MFLMGPLKQLKSMFDKGRIVASVVYLAAMALTLVSAIYVRKHSSLHAVFVLLILPLYNTPLCMLLLPL